MTQIITTRNWKARLVGKPQEDFASVGFGGKIIAVARGVTRDCTNGAPVESTLCGAWNTRSHYPRNPNPAQEVARITAAKLVDFPWRGVDFAFAGANKMNGLFNKTYIPSADYLVNDFAGAVASVAYLDNDELHWGYVCDSGVAVIGRDGNLRFNSEDEGPHAKKFKPFLDFIVESKGGWANPEARVAIRRDFRNKPDEAYSFGVLTGEPEALKYVRTGSFKIREGDTAIVYSSGAREALFENGDIRGSVSDAVVLRDWGRLKRILRKHVDVEGTLVCAVRR